MVKMCYVNIAHSKTSSFTLGWRGWLLFSYFFEGWGR